MEKIFALDHHHTPNTTAMGKILLSEYELLDSLRDNLHKARKHESPTDKYRSNVEFHVGDFFISSFNIIDNYNNLIPSKTQ